MSSITASALSIAGLLLLAFGADWLVRGSSRLATYFGVSPLLVGLTVVAYGTSSPETVASVIAALSGHAEMTVGNVLGSNIANVGLILGCAAIMAPLKVPASVLKRELPLLLGVTGLLFVCALRLELGRGVGLSFLALLVPGPILDPEGEGPDFWGWAPALWAAGFRRSDTVYNTFSYHLTPAGAMMEEGLRAIGCTVVPGGVGNTDAQVDLLARSRSTGYCGTPDFIWTLLDRAREKSIDVCLERGFVSGGPLSASLREDLLREVTGFRVACTRTRDVEHDAEREAGRQSGAPRPACLFFRRHRARLRRVVDSNTVR